MTTGRNRAAASWSDAATIAAAARLWLAPRSPWLARARRQLTAFSPRMVELGLRELFEDIAASVEELAQREAPAVTPPASRVTLCHILSGNLPNPGIVSIIVGLLAGARNIVKPSTGDPMPALWIESLASVDRRLAARVALTDDREAFRKAGTVIAYGNDATIAAIKAQCGTKRFFGFGHRVSIGLIHWEPSSAFAAARDASMWDQQGCMSPLCFYVKGDAAAFAATLADEMERFDRRWPRATLPFEQAAALASARNEWSFRGRVWACRRSTHWTVVLDGNAAWAPSPLNRFVFVRPIKSLAAVPHRLSTVGFAGFSLKEVMAMARADRYCSLGEMQRPSLLLTNGSRPRVSDLV